MFTVLSANNPRWTDQAHSAIVLNVIFEQTKETIGEQPFAASPNDSEPHGVELFERAKAGEFGEVQEPTREMILALVMCMRTDRAASATQKVNELLMAVEVLQDTIAAGLAGDEADELPARQAEVAAWRLYRVHLAQMEDQPDFPQAVSWPEQPASPFIYTPLSEPEVKAFQGVDPSELPKK
jgi:hypothetical protein